MNMLPNDVKQIIHHLLHYDLLTMVNFEIIKRIKHVFKQTFVVWEDKYKYSISYSYDSIDGEYVELTPYKSMGKFLRT